MNSRTLWWAVRIVAVLVLAAGTSALAQDWRHPVHFRGVINDFTPSTVTPKGPWEIRGPWTLTLKGASNKADFSASLTMALSDYTRNSTNVDDITSDSNSRMQHTHHITLEDGGVTQIPGGFEVSGPVSITKDGSPAPLTASTLVIDITGGTTVEFSNITLTFEGGTTGAPKHFGPQAIHGVVRSAE